MKNKRVAILGSTGSIGRQTLEVIGESPPLQACGLGARANWRLLAEQARRYRPEFVALAEAVHADALAAELPAGVELLSGPGSLCELVRRSRPDVTMTAVVGAAGLAPTLAAIEAGSALAIANKETLVCAGSLVLPAARAAGVAVLPVDSEHSGIFQCLRAGRRSEVRRVILTSSGGSLRDLDDQAVAEATVEQALAHPTWRMGPKVTIDSATLMNKALEVIEAHWLFDLAPERIEVVIHPQSIVHALVEFCDGSMLAQLARADMKGPIAYALEYPNRLERAEASLDLAGIGALEFRAPRGRFARAVALAYRAIRSGGVAGAVLNAANEAAVEAFLAGAVPFGRIVPLAEEVLNEAEDSPEFSARNADEYGTTMPLEGLLRADEWARRRVAELTPTAS